MAYLIWSYEHNSWWAPNHRGYTPEFDEAGRYSAQEAGDIVTQSIMMDELVVPEFWAKRYGSPHNHPYANYDY